MTHLIHKHVTEALLYIQSRGTKRTTDGLTGGFDVASPRDVGVCDAVSRGIDGRGQTQISINLYLASLRLIHITYVFYIQKMQEIPPKGFMLRNICGLSASRSW
jgi:hypothetical protein